MSTTYAQWRVSADKAEARRCIYVCGPERLLVQEDIDTTLSIVGPSHLDHVSVSAQRVAGADVWAYANAYPLTPNAPRLVCVRDAEALSDWAPLAGWLNTARRRPSTHLLFVSGQPDVPDADHITLLRKRSQGQVVRCTTPNEADLIAWVRRRCDLDVDLAVRLLNRVDWNVPAAADACAKLAVLGLRHVAPGTVDAVCLPPAGDLVEYLLAGDKARAITAVDQLDTAAIALLAARVDILERLWRAARAGVPTREIRDVPQFLTARYLPLAARYHPKRCAHARRLLAVAEDAYRNGARSGVAEALVALW